MKKREESENSEISQIYDKRIRSLSSGKIVLKIGSEMISSDPAVVEKFDLFFREIRSFINHGVFKKNKTSKILSKHIGKDPQSYISLYIAIKKAFSFISATSSIDKTILSNKV